MSGKFSGRPPHDDPWGAFGFWMAFAFVALVVVGAIYDAIVK